MTMILGAIFTKRNAKLQLIFMQVGMAKKCILHRKILGYMGNCYMNIIGSQHWGILIRKTSQVWIVYHEQKGFLGWTDLRKPVGENILSENYRRTYFGFGSPDLLYNTQLWQILMNLLISIIMSGGWRKKFLLIRGSKPGDWNMVFRGSSEW